WPRDTQCRVAAGRRAAASARSGKASSSIAITVTSWPAARAASRTRKGNRPLPAISPRRISFVSQHFFDPLGGAAQGHSAMRRPDELDDVLHVGAGQRAIPLDLPQSVGGVELRLQEIPKRPLQ